MCARGWVAVDDVLVVTGARLEGGRPTAAASERRGDKLLRRSDDAEQSKVPFPRTASRDTRGK